MTHLLITCAEDKTSDLVCERLAETVLRVNWERWPEYCIEISRDGFKLEDHYGRCVTNTTLGNVIWRKPVEAVPIGCGEFWYGFQEFKSAVLAIVAEVRRDAPHRVLLDPLHHANVDKFHQLRVAARYFRCPRWTFTTAPKRLDRSSGSWVAKNLTGSPIPGTGTPAKVLFTTQVDPLELAEGWPWFLQQAVDAGYDLTVVHVDGKSFGFVLDRSLFEGLDWRKAIGDPQLQAGWRAVKLPAVVERRLQQFMAELRLEFGRLDFLADDITCRDPVFLEVNPNGQWAWLDLDQSNGLFDAVIRFFTDDHAPTLAAQR